MKVTASASILIEATPEAVWDYTQNWNRRAEWDPGIRKARYLSETQPVQVEAWAPGGLRMVVTYKLSERPRLTTLAISDVRSLWLAGGGGSWRYESEAGGTRWTQHNTFVLREGLVGLLLRPLLGLWLSLHTRMILRRAKRRIERGA